MPSRATLITCWSSRVVARQSASTRSSWRPIPTRRWRCCATPVIVSTRSSVRSRISPTRRCSTPMCGCCPAAGARGRAGTTTCSPEPKPASTVTYHMNRLQSLRAEREFCVTLNRTEAIDPAHVIRTIPYAHPVYTAAGVKAQARVGEIDGRNRTHFCGAYWGWGFHEDGVRQRAAGGRALRGAAVSASCIYEGTIRHRRFEPPARVQPSTGAGLPRPGRAPGAA